MTKKTERLLINLSSEMAERVRALAEKGHRSLQGEIRWLIESSPDYAALRKPSNDIPGEKTLLRATARNSEEGAA